jgi:hypothetical protein
MPWLSIIIYYCVTLLSHLIISRNRIRVRVMVLNATFNNILAISWRSVLLAEETRVPGKNPTDLPQVTVKQMLYRVHLAWVGFQLTTLVVIGTDCIDSCKSNYHAITTTTAPQAQYDKRAGIAMLYTWAQSDHERYRNIHLDRVIN